MSTQRTRADSVLDGSVPRIKKIQCDVLESVGLWNSGDGMHTLINNATSFPTDASTLVASNYGQFTACSNSGGNNGGSSNATATGKDGGEVVTHDLYGDYEDDDGAAPSAAPAPSSSSATAANNNSANTTANDNGVRITRQEGYVYKTEGSMEGGQHSGGNTTTTTINRWAVENNVALLVLKKELQIDRSAVRERRTAKKLMSGDSVVATPRALAGSLSFDGGVTPRGGGGAGGAIVATPRGTVITPRSGGNNTINSLSSPRGVGGGGLGFLDLSRLGNGTISGSELESYLLYAQPYAAPTLAVQMPEQTLLAQPLKNEIELLKQRCAELEAVAGIQTGEDVTGTTKTLFRRIQLLNERVVEELSNRVDATIASIRYKDSKKDILAVEAGMTPNEMADAFQLSQIIDACYEHHIDALGIIRRLHSLRLLHQEAFQRVGALSLLRTSTLETRSFVSSALDEIEEMRLGTKEVNGAVNESLAYFRTRLQALSGKS